MRAYMVRLGRRKKYCLKLALIRENIYTIAIVMHHPTQPPPLRHVEQLQQQQQNKNQRIINNNFCFTPQMMVHHHNSTLLLSLVGVINKQIKSIISITWVDWFVYVDVDPVLFCSVPGCPSQARTNITTWYAPGMKPIPPMVKKGIVFSSWIPYFTTSNNKTHNSQPRS